MWTFSTPRKTSPTIVDVKPDRVPGQSRGGHGANGAGKSTAIKALVGEQLPTSGSIWKVAGLRLAYVAQHASTTLRSTMQETPTQYIVWRFAGNDDKESIEFKSDELSVDELSARSVKWCIDGVTGSVRPCTDPKSDAKKAKADVAGDVVRRPR